MNHVVKQQQLYLSIHISNHLTRSMARVGLNQAPGGIKMPLSCIEHQKSTVLERKRPPFMQLCLIWAFWERREERCAELIRTSAESAMFAMEI